MVIVGNFCVHVGHIFVQHRYILFILFHHLFKILRRFHVYKEAQVFTYLVKFRKKALYVTFLSSEARILHCVVATWCRLSTTATYKLKIKLECSIFLLLSVWTRCNLVFRLLILTLILIIHLNMVLIVINVLLIDLFKLF